MSAIADTVLAMTTCQTIALDYEERDEEYAGSCWSAYRSTTRIAGYQPHPKSMPLERLATHVADLASWPKLALESELLELQPGFKMRIAGSTVELLEIFDQGVKDGPGGNFRALPTKT